MRYVTVCENLGPHKVPGANHDQKFDKFRMLPGTAWKMDETTGERVLVEVDEETAGKAKYDWTIAMTDSRNVAVFLVDDQRYSQPITEDPRAKDRRLGSARLRKLRKPRHEAPGVAPEVPADQDEPAEPAPRRARAAPKERKPRKALGIVI